MTSFVTNMSSQVALRTLQAIATDADRVQNALGTGKRVANAQDNAAFWALSKTVEADVAGFVAVQSSLDMGKATISVARSGAESLVDTLGNMKQTIIAADTPAADAEKLQARFEAQMAQVETVVRSAQFNGLNLLRDEGAGEETGDFDVMAFAGGRFADSLKFNVARQDLRLDAAEITAGSTAVFDALNAMSGAMESGASLSAGGSSTVTVRDSFAAGTGFSLQITGASGGFSGLNTTSESDLAFVAGNSATGNDVKTALISAFNKHITDSGLSGCGITATAGAATGQMTISVGADAPSGSFTVRVRQYDATDSSGGGLGFLNGLDLTQASDRTAALDRIDLAVDVAARAASAFGAAERQIDVQARFADDMAMVLKSRVGTMVDADLTAVSARQQALQVQQSLAVQALSIANSSPQVLLQLLR
ncbi:flagellin [Pacificoceanicola onchidii]|uniref:flagellin n=1 Tax=Pacificoceanicola onchidii TaxID=2562685 RepID=UPI001456198B|nr:flagellin [Pacificoceanicola onchidii]